MPNTFPHQTSRQLVTDMANSVKQTINLLREHGNTRVNHLDDYFAVRVHELMNYRSHTVNTDW